MPPRTWPTPRVARARLRPTRLTLASGPSFPPPSSVLPCSRSGVTASETRAGPITACTPGSLEIFRCQRLSASSRSGSVIGPLSVAATTTKGDSKPGPTERAISSLSVRA